MDQFKKWLENTAGLKIGLVGWTGSSTDQALFSWVEDFLCNPEGRHHDLDIAEGWATAKKDVININQGRDFLEENQTYDIVILCWVFAPVTYRGYEGEYNVSQKHTPQEWKTRLISTGAKYIFASGGNTEVSGEYLGAIQGYRTVKASSSLTAYMNWNLYA